MSPDGAASKRPPKLRSACNECHAAKVRCSGEKTGCQRCANLNLGCVFAISRIGKVPGKRSKANRAAAAAAAAAVAAASSSTSTLASNSTSSISSSTASLMSPETTVDELHPSHTRRYSESHASDVAIMGVPYGDSETIMDSRAIPTAAPVCSIDQPLHSEGYSRPGSLVMPDGLHGSYPGITEPALNDIDMALAQMGDSCWDAKIEPPTCGMLSPALTSPMNEGYWAHGCQRNYTVKTEGEDISNTDGTRGHIADGSGIPMGQASTPPVPQLLTPPELCLDEGSYPMGAMDSLAPGSICTLYLHLIQNIERTIQIGQPSKSGHTVDSVLAANQRFLTTLLQITVNPNFGQVYDDHLLFFVAFNKILNLFNFGYRDFIMRLDAHESVGCSDRLIRFGVFEIDFVEQKIICRSILMRELKRASTCLSRMMDALGKADPRCGMGRHENLCREMNLRLEQLMCALEETLAR